MITKIKPFTIIVGLVFITLGVLGFVPAFVSSPHLEDPMLSVLAGYGRLFDLFPVNLVHNLFCLVLGAWALTAASSVWTSKSFCRTAAVVMGALTIMGLIPVLNTVFGLMPVFSHNIWFHAVAAVITGYFGFAVPSARTQTTIFYDANSAASRRENPYNKAS